MRAAVARLSHDWLAGQTVSAILVTRRASDGTHSCQNGGFSLGRMVCFSLYTNCNRSTTCYEDYLEVKDMVGMDLNGQRQAWNVNRRRKSGVTA